MDWCWLRIIFAWAMATFAGLDGTKDGAAEAGMGSMWWASNAAVQELLVSLGRERGMITAVER
jgi:hypothetical protein